MIFWAVDPTGSLRSDQPLFPNIHEQNTFRELAIKDPSLALPKDKKVIDQLTREGLASHGFGSKKTATVDEAIQNVGEYWFRDTLMQCKPTSLEDFFE